MDFFITTKKDIDLKNIPDDLKLKIVSFDISVLDKYKDDQIKLNEGAWELIDNGWSLQIDVGDNHVSTFLYKLAILPEDEIKHFQTKNIWPIPLSATAHRRWIQGMP